MKIPWMFTELQNISICTYMKSIYAPFSSEKCIQEIFFLVKLHIIVLTCVCLH